MKNKTVIYTPEDEKRLNHAKENFVHQLEQVIQSKKYYPGDDILEITASEIEKAVKNYEFKTFNHSLIGRAHV